MNAPIAAAAPPLPRRALGSTGVSVSIVGLGAGSLGDADLTEQTAEALLHGALDLGIDLIDTAPSYGPSEERIGRHLAGVRDRYVLSTKCGYGVPGVEDWTPECIRQNVERALRRLRTDRIDVLHLHSCPLETLQRPGLIEALEDVVRAGKVRFAAYSGENDALAWAVTSGRFAVVQRSVNLVDQGVWRMPTDGPAVGVLAKRPLANAAWTYETRPERPDVAEYWERLRALGIDAHDLPRAEFALRFAAYAPNVTSVLVGTRHLGRLTEMVAQASRGPLPEAWVEEVRAAYGRQAAQWPGVV